MVNYGFRESATLDNEKKLKICSKEFHLRIHEDGKEISLLERQNATFKRDLAAFRK